MFATEEKICENVRVMVRDQTRDREAAICTSPVFHFEALQRLLFNKCWSTEVSIPQHLRGLIFYKSTISK
jgi:hypothetical protein